MILPDRYYTPQALYFEDDGVITSQTGGYQVMSVNPPLNITKVQGNLTISTSLLQLYGNASTYIGQGSVDIYSHSRYSQPAVSNGLHVVANNSYIPFVYTFEIGTQYPCAWSGFLNRTMVNSGVPTASFSFTPYSGPCYNPTGTTYDMTLKISNVDYAVLDYAGVQVSLGVGGT